MPFLQDLIHKIDEGVGKRYARRILSVLAVLLFVVVCNWRNFKNFSAQEAMDSAQLARNISEGKGYKTLFVRPLSIHLVETKNRERSGPSPDGERVDYARLRETMHPDVANPPVYPVVLAGWMKVYHWTLQGMDAVRNIMPGFVKGHLPQFNDSTKNPVWQKNARLWWYPSDFFIGVFNQLLFFALVVMVFFWARKLFDRRVAWVSTALLFGSEYLWRFSFSGLSTMLLAVIFMGLIWSLTFFEREVREPVWNPRGLVILSGAVGLLVGLGGLTRYSFVWLIIPVIIFMVLFGGVRRVVLCLAALAVFAAVMSPWIVRNYHLTGTAFGTSSYTVLENSQGFPEYKVQRALETDFSQFRMWMIWNKLVGNTRTIIQNDLPKLGGSWVTALFLAGLLIGFLNVTIRRMRYFILLCLGILIVVQALGRTQLSEDSPDFNSENLLVLLVPLVTVFGVSLFFVLLDQMNLPVRALRYVVISLFTAVICLPLAISFLPPSRSPSTYPPYNPPLIEYFSGWMKADELVMSDIPWAVAWYGKRQCVWLTLNAQPDFFRLSVSEKNVNALYLTSVTMGKRSLTELFNTDEQLKAGEQSWSGFIGNLLLRKELPSNFLLYKIAPIRELLPDNIFLTDWERWKKLD